MKQRVGHFEKVSFEQFYAAMTDILGDDIPPEAVRKDWERIELPTRSTAGSAGYDFHMPLDICLKSGQTAKIPTGIRVAIDEGWFLGCFPRSGLGFKYRIQLDNTVGIIDSDYYDSDNEGHIFAKITNDSRDDKTVYLDFGDKFMQGVFLPYGITYTDDVTAERNGGFGSTDRA